MLNPKKIPITIRSGYFQLPKCTVGHSPVLNGIGVIVISGILALLLFCILLLPGWAASPIFVATSIVIVSAVFIAIFALVFVHLYRKCARQTGRSEVPDTIPPKVDTVDAHVLASTCPICLSALKDGSTIHQTGCCSNHLHRKCLSAYVRHFRDYHLSDPPCVLCRAQPLSVGV